MHNVVWHLYDICAVHIRRNNVHSLSKLLVVTWLGLTLTVRFRVRAKDRRFELGTGNGFHSVFVVSISKGDKHLCLALLKLELVPREQRIIDDERLEDSEKENCCPVNKSLSTMEDARFGTKLTMFPSLVRRG